QVGGHGLKRSLWSAAHTVIIPAGTRPARPARSASFESSESPALLCVDAPRPHSGPALASKRRTGAHDQRARRTSSWPQSVTTMSALAHYAKSNAITPAGKLGQRCSAAWSTHVGH